jgi:outer membrane immunogenic protein
MRVSILLAGLAATVLASSAAVAADMRSPAPYYSAPAPAQVGYRWAGAYAGLNLGYQWGSVDASGAEPSGFAGGIQAGYNWQNNQFVYGLETDLQISGADDTFAGYKFSNPWFGTLRGRLGWSMNNILLYGTAGLAYGGLDVELGGASEDNVELGWTAGLGMEIGFTPNWSAKVEYLYMDLGNSSFALTGNSNGYDASMLRFGVNYHF